MTIDAPHPIILEPFQVTGRDFLASRFHAILGDDPGTGKTLQALHAADKANAATGLVTCPASVRDNWRDHIREHRGSAELKYWDIISYNGASDKAVRAVLKKSYDVWIGDEIQNAKTLDSQRTQAVFGSEGVARLARYKWPMSGTVAPNYRPIELYPVLKALHPAFSSYKIADYALRYCGAFYEPGRGLNTKGASRVEELANLLRGFMLRRTKKEVFPNRKDPIIVRHLLELTEADLAAVIEEENKIGAREARVSTRFDDFSQMGDMSRLLRLLGEAKVAGALRFIGDKVDGGIKKFVVFAYHTNVIKRLRDGFAEMGYMPATYVGGMTDAHKAASIKIFERDPGCKVFIGQHGAAGTGINGLQRVSSMMADVEPRWTPGDTHQRIDRLDRMGRESLEDELVTAYMLVARGTLDAVVTQVHDRKERVGERLFAPAASNPQTVLPALSAAELDAALFGEEEQIAIKDPLE